MQLKTWVVACGLALAASQAQAEVQESTAISYVGKSRATSNSAESAKKEASSKARNEALKECQERMKDCFVVSQFETIESQTRTLIDPGTAGEFRGLGGRIPATYQTEVTVSSQVLVIGSN